MLIVWTLISGYITMMRTVHSVAQSQMEEIANSAIHTAIDVTSQKYNYSELVDIYRSSDGSIQSVSVDTMKANNLKSEIAKNVIDYLNTSEHYTVSVPLGNFLGSEFLSGFGPKIKFRIIPFDIAHIDFESKFTPAGINQVLHTLSVKVDVNIGALLPGFEEISNLTSRAVVAETVIIGDVPETYFNVEK